MVFVHARCVVQHADQEADGALADKGVPVRAQTDAEERAGPAGPVEQAEALFFLGDVVVGLRLLGHLLPQQSQSPARLTS